MVARDALIGGRSPSALCRSRALSPKRIQTHDFVCFNVENVPGGRRIGPCRHTADRLVLPDWNLITIHVPCMFAPQETPLLGFLLLLCSLCLSHLALRPIPGETGNGLDPNDNAASRARGSLFRPGDVGGEHRVPLHFSQRSDSSRSSWRRRAAPAIGSAICAMTAMPTLPSFVRWSRSRRKTALKSLVCYREAGGGPHSVQTVLVWACLLMWHS